MAWGCAEHESSNLEWFNSILSATVGSVWTLLFTLVAHNSMFKLWKKELIKLIIDINFCPINQTWGPLMILSCFQSTTLSFSYLYDKNKKMKKESDPNAAMFYSRASESQKKSYFYWNSVLCCVIEWVYVDELKAISPTLRWNAIRQCERHKSMCV